MAELVEEATAEVLARQAEIGIDIAGNGEQGRDSFFTYVRYRMTGFDGVSSRKLMRDMTNRPDFLERQMRHWKRGDQVSLMRAPAATGDVAYIGQAELADEIGQLVRLGGAHGFAELFMTATSPGIVAAAMTNEHYETLDDYVEAVADAVSVEYRAIVEAGLVLQIDAPDLAMERHASFADESEAAFLDFVETVVAGINRSLVGCDPERVRLHVCWGNYEGPHDLDIPFETIASRLAEVNAEAIVLSLANPRHAHEYRYLDQLPASWTVVAGAIDTTTNYIEHPEVVADRLRRVVDVVGPDRVIAGTDCGFGTAAGFGEIAPSVVWHKLESLVAGAALAQM